MLLLQALEASRTHEEQSTTKQPKLHQGLNPDMADGPPQGQLMLVVPLRSWQAEAVVMPYVQSAAASVQLQQRHAN